MAEINSHMLTDSVILNEGERSGYIFKSLAHMIIFTLYKH